MWKPQICGWKHGRKIPLSDSFCVGAFRDQRCLEPDQPDRTSKSDSRSFHRGGLGCCGFHHDHHTEDQNQRFWRISERIHDSDCGYDTVLSELATPISMACRHFGNILSGVVINALIYGSLALASGKLLGLLPGVLGRTLSQIPILDVGVPAVLSVYFDWFSGVMQAFIFCMLTVMYIANAAEEG